jgi:hypothetical protein
MSGQRLLALAGLAAGVVLIAVAIVWFAVPAKDLPGFMGHISGATVHRTKRGWAALVVGIICLAVGGYLVLATRRPGPPAATD